jgi:peptidoglycan-N-acetylglucosamine deacetylase
VIGPASVGLGLGIATGLWGAYYPNSPVFGRVIAHGPREPVAYLTFDDGPNPGVTECILSILEEENVPATFFMVGRYVRRHPVTARAVAQAGHEIGNHTFSHVRLDRVGPWRAAREIRRTHEAITDATGFRARSFRAPHGYRGPFVSQALAPFHYRVYGWTFGVRDSDCPGSDLIRARVRKRLRRGAIVLLHDGDGYRDQGNRWQTANALVDVIRDARAAGYRFERLSSLVPT